MPIKFPDGNGGIMLVGTDFSSVRANFNQTTLEGNPVFAGSPTFKESVKAASIVADFTDSTLLGVNISGHSAYFEDEVSLHGGARIWGRGQIAQGTSIWGNSAYFDYDNTTINAGSNLHYTGKHFFDDKVTLKSGFYVADSMKNDLGSHGSINASNDTINIAQSTITGAATVTGKQTFGAEVTLQGGAVIQDDIAFNDSLDIDCGRHALIDARHDTIKLTNSTISGNHTVDGNAYYQGVHCFTDEVSLKSCTVSGNHTIEGNAYHYGINRFYDDASFDKGVKFYDKASLLGGVFISDSMNNDFGSRGSIKAMYDTLDCRFSYIRFDGATVSGLSLDGGGGDYTLPTASTSTKGGIKVGTGLSMNEETLNVDTHDLSFDFSNKHIYGTAMSLEAASAYFGISQSTIAGTLRLKDKTTGGVLDMTGSAADGSIQGAVHFTDKVVFEKGATGFDLPTASESTKGGVKVGAGLSMNGETLNCTISGKVILDTVPSTVEGAMWYVL